MAVRAMPSPRLLAMLAVKRLAKAGPRGFFFAASCDVPLEPVAVAGASSRPVIRMTAFPKSRYILSQEVTLYRV